MGIRRFVVAALLMLLNIFNVHALESSANGSIDVVNAEISVKPARCIALHEGQQCYQNLQISWNADVADDYCLYQQDIKEPLTCWQQLRFGSGVYDFVNNTSVKFLLIRKRDGQVVAEFLMEVAWVYDAQPQRKSHWRVF